MRRTNAFARLVPILVGFCCLAFDSAASDGAPPKPDKPAAAVIDASAYPNLQAAFDAVPDSGGLVKLPPGNFEITEPLVLTKANTRVEGSGTATHVLNGNTQGKPALIIRPPDFEKNPKSRLWRVQLANFRVSGDPGAPYDKSTQPKSGDGVLAQNIDEIYLEGMTVDHNGGHGVTLVRCIEDPRVADSLITYNAQAGLNIVGGHDIVVNANHFEENQDAVRCIDSYNLCMNGNNVDDHLGNGVVIENTYGSVLSGNMIEECQGVGVILDRDCYGITISANVLADNTGGGVELRDAWGCAVSANTFTINIHGGLRIGPQSGRITVTGNNFSDSFIGDRILRPKHAGTTGMVLEGATDVTISGNLFSGLNTPAIAADKKSQRLNITGNIVTDVNRGAGEARAPIAVDGAGQSLIENNLIGTPAK